MLYPNSRKKELDMDIFKNPPSEYRAAPFWAWNCDLKEDVLLRQIEYLKEMGFGGFYIHSRSGMSKKYLGKEYMSLVKSCVEKAEQEDMCAWLYDEDRWPSGFGGGYVTQNKKYRKKKIILSKSEENFVSKEYGIANALPYLVAVYDIIFDEVGRLIDYKTIKKDDNAEGIKIYAYVSSPKESGQYNNQTYVDTMSYEAISEFIKTTHEAYKSVVGNEFGKTVPGIFTDEPHIPGECKLGHGLDFEFVSLPWTTDFDESYKKRYSGDDIISKLPEVVWDKSDGGFSQARYRFYDHACEKFVESYMDQIGKWCEDNSIALTGHVLCESELLSQTDWLGEAMRTYRSFTIPGIDMLCNGVELTTVKQAQSVVHQYGREGLMSELYGVTNWDFDFRGHKFQGDWQAALGVTQRVPHHSWVSMKGAAKRDFPASINYQSPWYKDYSYVENHFARLNTVLTRGKPIVNVAVIHPIESMWISRGPNNTSYDICDKIENDFKNITKWLLSGMVDFDFISESLLTAQKTEISSTLKVGEMEYKTIVVPECITMRRNTLNILKEFRRNGGKIIFVGECPKCVDALESDDVRDIYDISIKVGNNKNEILKALTHEQTAEILNSKGETEYKFVHCLRQDGNKKWFFLAHIEEDERKDNISEDNISIILDGEYIPKLYNTIDASISKPDFETKDGKTYIYFNLFSNDSLLIELSDGSGCNKNPQPITNIRKSIKFTDGVSFEREEENVYVLDIAKYALDDEEFSDFEELIIADDKCRRKLNYTFLDDYGAQPWVLGDDIIEHYVKLRFSVMSEADLDNVLIAGEEAVSISVNGREISLCPNGFYVDESIKKYNIGKICKGENEIEIKTPIGTRTNIENYFLIGDFNVKVNGCKKILMPSSNKIYFGDITNQGMPFYGGNLIYSAKINTPDCNLNVCTYRYRGAAVKVYLDDEEKGIIAYSPYTLTIKNVPSGEHTLKFKLLGNRANTFGPLHSCDYDKWYGSNMWVTYSCKTQCEENLGLEYSTKWSYEYILKETGILSSPIVIVEEL